MSVAPGFRRVALGAGLIVLGAVLAFVVAVRLQQPPTPASKVEGVAAALLRPSPPAERSADATPKFAYSLAGRGQGADGHALVFLTRDSNLYTLQVGGIIDERWRVDAIEADALRLTYLPLGTPLHIAYSELPAPQTVARPAASPRIENGVATREMVVSTRDPRELQALMANPPPGALIRIDDGTPRTASVAPRSVPAAAVQPPPGRLLRGDGSAVTAPAPAPAPAAARE